MMVTLCTAMNMVLLYTFVDNEPRRNDVRLRNFARVGFNLHGEINVRRDSTGGIVVDNKKQQHAQVPAAAVHVEAQDTKSLNDNAVLNTIQQRNKDQGAKDDNNAKSKDKEAIIKILKESGAILSAGDIAQLPTWSEVTSLYGTKPQIVGLDQCKHLQLQIPKTPTLDHQVSSTLVQTS